MNAAVEWTETERNVARDLLKLPQLQKLRKLLICHVNAIFYLYSWPFFDNFVALLTAFLSVIFFFFFFYKKSPKMIE